MQPGKIVLPGVGRTALTRFLLGGGGLVGRAESEGRREAAGDLIKFNFPEHFHFDYLLYIDVMDVASFCPSRTA